MSATKQFMMDHPGQNFDGSPIQEFEPAYPTYESLLPTKQTIELAVQDFKEKLLEGLIDYREALLRKKIMSDMLEQAFKDKDVKDYLEEQYAKEGTKQVDFKGAKIAYTQRKNYSYDQCGDSAYNRLKTAADVATKALKEREKFLQLLGEPTTVVHAETGEVETIYPAAFTVTDYFTITLPKQ